MYSTAVNVDWDDATASWVLNSTFAAPVQVLSYTSLIDQRGVGFTVPGAEPVTAPDESEGWWRVYAAYPGIYQVTLNIDPATVADLSADPLQRDLVVIPQSVPGDYNPNIKILRAKPTQSDPGSH